MRRFTYTLLTLALLLSLTACGGAEQPTTPDPAAPEDLVLEETAPEAAVPEEMPTPP